MIRRWLRTAHEAIIEYLLRRGADPKARMRLPWASTNHFATNGLGDGTLGRALSAHELAAAYGPATEAWYLDLLRRCGFLDDEVDIRRLHELEDAGHAACRRVVKRNGETNVNDQVKCCSAKEEDALQTLAIRSRDGGGVLCSGTDILELFDERNGSDDDEEEFWDAEESS